MDEICEQVSGWLGRGPCKRILIHYTSQTEEDAVAEDEAVL